MRRLSAQAARIVNAMMAEPMTWFHGYDLSRATGLASGTLYPILIRLAERGWLEARWDDEAGSGPRRHLYRITAAGRHAIEPTRQASAPTAARHREQPA